MDIRSRVVSLEHQSTLTSQRLVELEKWQRKSEVDDARNDERMTSLATDVKGIKSGIGRLFWIIVAAIAAVLVTFAMNGGFVKAKETASLLIDTVPPVMPASRPLTCPAERPVLVRAYCRAPAQKPWFGTQAVLRSE